MPWLIAVLAALAGFLDSAHSAFIKAGLAKMNLWVALGVSSMITSVIFCGTYFLKHTPRQFVQECSSRFMLILIGAAVLQLLSLGLSFEVLRKGEISRVLPIGFAMAVLTSAVIGMVFFKEPITVSKVGATFLITVGMWMLTN